MRGVTILALAAYLGVAACSRSEVGPSGVAEASTVKLGSGLYRFCDHGRAVYVLQTSYGAAIDAVPDAAECATPAVKS